MHAASTGRISVFGQISQQNFGFLTKQTLAYRVGLLRTGQRADAAANGREPLRAFLEEHHVVFFTVRLAESQLATFSGGAEVQITVLDFMLDLGIK
jgi:hypothetical protein